MTAGRKQAAKRLDLGPSVDRAVAEAMVRDERVLVFGEDVALLRPALFARFGASRVMNTPISESAFLGSAVGAAMAGLRPVVEIMLVDFIAVAMSAVLNEMAKISSFSGGRWTVPLVVRATCGGGYGDGGQHSQALWGMLGGIAGLKVCVPSTPADAAGIMRAAIEDDGPVIFLEHKLISGLWLDTMGGSSRDTVTFDVPEGSGGGEVAEPVAALPLGQAVVRRTGSDVTIASVGVSVHRALQAATELERTGVSAEVIDLRTVQPLDRDGVRASVSRTGRLLVVDEDYREFGLTGELAAVMLEAGLAPRFARVATDTVIPYARSLESATLPSVRRIVDAVRTLMEATA
ncbi:MAG: transketolase C-terminal domain-containing protein [Gemmatimonadota bacterium]